MGDILFDDLSMFPRYNALIAQIGIPWYNVPGNHELNFEAESDEDSLETFKRFFGPPTTRLNTQMRILLCSIILSIRAMVRRTLAMCAVAADTRRQLVAISSDGSSKNWLMWTKIGL